MSRLIKSWYLKRHMARGKARLNALLALFVVLFLSATLLKAEEEIYKIGDGVSAPKVIHKVRPSYTKRAKKAKLEGMVKLGIVVSSQGIPEDIQVVTGLNPDLDAQAIKAVSKWRFAPAEKSGTPVAVRATVEVNFRLCCGW